MKILFAALLFCAAPTWAQSKPANGLPFPLVSPARAQQMAEKKIVLHLRDATLLEALQSLQKQSGVRFDSGELVARRIFARKLSLDLETTSFDRAFDAILKAAKTEAKLESSIASSAWNLRFGHFKTDDSLPQSGVGAFQIRLQSVNSALSKSVKPGADKTKAPKRTAYTETTLALDSVPAPGLKIVGAPHFCLVRADDETGRSLLPREKDNPFPFGFERGAARAVRLQTPAPTTRKLARVAGTATFLVSTQIEHWEVADLLSTKNVSHTFGRGAGATKVTLQSAQRIGDSVNLEISVTAPPGEDLFSLRAPLLSSEILLGALAVRRADGQTVNSGGYAAAGANDSMSVRASFYLGSESKPQTPASDAALTLVLDAPTEIVQTQVPFSFENVPLP